MCNIVLLSGLGDREMLWIEYESGEEVTISAVHDVLNSLAKIVSPFPICAYDRGDNGLRPMAHDGILQDDSPSTSDSSSRTHCGVDIRQHNTGGESSSLSGSFSNGSNDSTLTEQASSHSHLQPNILNNGPTEVWHLVIPSDSVSDSRSQGIN
jgi:hypothetical protein